MYLPTTDKIILSTQAWNYASGAVFFNPISPKRKRAKKVPTDQNAPQMLTVKELSERTGVSEHIIRKLCKTGEIHYIKTGVKYLINYNRFLDYLNGTM